MKQNMKSIVSNLIVAFSAQGVSLIVSAAMSLLVPKVLGVEGFGYWQLFIFYSSYCGFFHLGLNDGIYLINGGKSRSDVNKRSIVSQFRVELVSQIIIAVCIALAALLGSWGSERTFVLIAVAIYLVLFNASGFLGYLFQAMNETKLYSISCIIDRILFFIMMIILIIDNCTDFQSYVISYGISKTISLIYCFWHARDFFAQHYYGLKKSVSETIRSIGIGINLMFANIADMLILGVARVLVDALWGIEVFGKVSLALSLVNFFITFVTQASMVLFPALRRCSKEQIKWLFTTMRTTMDIVFPILYFFFYPMSVFISFWLPQYQASIPYFCLLLPLCIFNTKMNLCGSTYLKVLRHERILLYLNLVTVVVSTISTLLCIYLLNSIWAVLAGISFSVAARSVIAELLVSHEIGAASGNSFIYEIILTILFEISALFIGGATGFIIYLICYSIYIILNKDRCSYIIKKFLNRC